MPDGVTFKGRGAKIPYKKLLQAKPVRNSSVELDMGVSDGAKLYLPYKKSAILKLVGRFVDIPDERTFKFNTMGYMVWELCDGEKTVQEIKDIIQSRSKGSDRDIERRLIKFLDRLLKNDLIILSMS